MWKVGVLGAVALLLVAGSSVASTVIELDAQQMVARSQAIVIGEVITMSSRNDGRYIVTDVTIRLDRAALKGNLLAGKTMTLTELGGELDGLVMRVAGAPAYRIGEQVAVFAAGRPDGSFRTLGLQQGKFRIQEAEVVRELAADSDAAQEGLAMAEAEATLDRTDSAARFPERMPLADFVSRVESLVRNEKEVRR